MKRSPFFYDMTLAGAQLAGAQGWEIAQQFRGTREEHLGVRASVGWFDWSTTGEILIQGADALKLVQKLIVNDASNMPVHRVLYSTMLEEDGGILSDITVYRLDHDQYLIMTAWGSNAANERPEYDMAVRAGAGMNAAIVDISSGTAVAALQGPRSRELLMDLAPAFREELASLPYMWGMPAEVAGIRAYISRTGYTGELGYEVIFGSEHAHDFWTAMNQAGEKYGLVLCGMGTAFSLRIEKGYIMRFDFVGGRTPYEAGLGWTVKMDKGDFIGREALIRRREAGFGEKLVSLTISDGYLPSGGAQILLGAEPAGQVTSAAFGYSIDKALALAYLPVTLAEVGVQVMIRDAEGGSHPAQISPRSVYDPTGSRLRS